MENFNVVQRSWCSDFARVVVGMVEKKIGEMEGQFKDYRLTPQRKLVLKIFLENKERHLSAEEVFQLSREKNEDIGLATIYRTLDLLDDLDLLHKMNFGDGRSRYELTSTNVEQHHHHHHLVCLKCNRIYEGGRRPSPAVGRRGRESIPVLIINHNLQFFGYCAKCREKADDQRIRREQPAPE